MQEIDSRKGMFMRSGNMNMYNVVKVIFGLLNIPSLCPLYINISKEAGLLCKGRQLANLTERSP